MVFMSRTRLVVGLVVALLAALPAARVDAQAAKEKAKFAPVSFKTYDGVELAGHFYSPVGPRKDATVLFLHHFDHKAGGNSTVDGWPKFAEKLAEEGYSVLSFDFRGFGSSKAGDSAVFWGARNRENSLMVKRGKGKGETIDQKDFTAGYYKHLVQDVAAAKTFLDLKNDANEVNSGNLIVIGAGQGATIGAMWLASECRRRRDNTPLGLLPGTMLGDPEGKDVAAAIWLTISPRLGTQDVGGLVQSWTKVAAKESKINMAFIYGKGDKSGDTFAQRCLDNAFPERKPPKKAKMPDFTGDKAIDDAEVTDSKLLAKTFGTEKWIIKSYLEPLMEKRGAPVRVQRKNKDSRFYYVIPLPGNPNPAIGRKILAKQVNDEGPPVVDLNTFFGR